MGTCARRALTSVWTQSGAVNGPLPSASPAIPPRYCTGLA